MGARPRSRSLRTGEAWPETASVVGGSLRPGVHVDGRGPVMPVTVLGSSAGCPDRGRGRRTGRLRRRRWHVGHAGRFRRRLRCEQRAGHVGVPLDVALAAELREILLPS